MAKSPFLSVISPVYRAEHVLEELVERIANCLLQITDDFEILLVDDYSPDGSWGKIISLAVHKPFLKGIKLSRNFGQHYAISAGLDQAKGEWVVVMDCDLQDQPEEIYNLYHEAIRGYDVVLARRINRRDGFFRKFFSKFFYRTLGYLTGSEQDETIGNFGIYHKRVIDEIVQMRESIRYFPTMVKWVGFRQSTLEVNHFARAEGNSNYTFAKLFHLATDIILAYSDRPLRIFVKLGIWVAFTGFAFALFTLIQYLSGEIVVMGYASLIISIWVLAGCLLTCLGMVGLYVGKTFEGVKNRPIYIIEKTT